MPFDTTAEFQQCRAWEVPQAPSGADAQDLRRGPENLAAQIDAHVQLAAALGFEVDADQHLVAAYPRLAERLKAELGDAAANADDQPAAAKASQRDADAACRKGGGLTPYSSPAA